MDWPECDLDDAPLPSRAGEAAVYHLRPRGEDAAGLLAELTAAERERAGRLKVERARREFIVGRAALRRLLARATGCKAASLPLGAGEHGKPMLAGCPLAFNVAHSGGEVIIALGLVLAIGVDLEQPRGDVEVLALAEDHFAAEEYALLVSLPEGERAAMFFRLWTAKEAVLKAHGGGLTVPLRAFALRGLDEPETVSVAGADGAPRRFTVRRLDSGHGGEASLAVEGGALARLRTFTVVI